MLNNNNNNNNNGNVLVLCFHTTMLNDSHSIYFHMACVLFLKQYKQLCMTNILIYFLIIFLSRELLTCFNWEVRKLTAQLD